MWTLIILSVWALQCSVFASPPEPINASFSSVNLRNVLHWVQGNDSPEDTQFIVKYAIYGESIKGINRSRVHWREVQQCTKITRTWCDLSKETEDEEESYYAKVRAVRMKASSKWALTQRRFSPKSDTCFGPPVVTVELENNSAIIAITGPMRYLPTKNATLHSMASIYPQMTYNLSIKNTNRNKMHHFLVASSPYKYSLMDYNNIYCFSARAKFLIMPVECQSSAWHCITTHPDPVVENLKKVFGTVVPVLCIFIIVVVGYVLFQYLTGNGQKSPYILKLPFFHPSSITIHPDTMSPIQIHPKEILLSAGAMLQGRQCIFGPPQSYSPQGHGSPLQPEEHRDEMDYGFVSHAHRADGEKKEDKNLDNGSSIVSDQEKSYLTQTSTHTCKPTNMPPGTQTHTQIRNPLWQPGGWSALNNIDIPAKDQPLLEPFQHFTKERVDKNEKISNLFANKSQHAEKKGMMCERENNLSLEERENGEKVPLLSAAYASQNQHCSNSEDLPDDYGVIMPDTSEKTHKDDCNDGGYEGTCVDWDAETGKIVLQNIKMESGDVGVIEGLMVTETNRAEGQEAAVDLQCLGNGGLRLENVFVRQGSEEKAQSEMEGSREKDWEVADVFKKWNLVIGNNE